MNSRSAPTSPCTDPDALDSPARIGEIRTTINRKPSIREFYRDIYRRYAACMERCPSRGIALELGSGGGFAQEMIPEIITSDILPYDGVDRVVDATRLPFGDESLRFIAMTNVFHHIPDVEGFFREAERCLITGGRILIVDQHLGYITRPILRHLHHEPYDPDAAGWRFAATGPLSGANGALPWLVFVRDRQRFRMDYTRLSLVAYRPHSPLFYWLAGGLKKWSLLPGWAVAPARLLDRMLLRCSSDLGSFTDIELVKLPSGEKNHDF